MPPELSPQISPQISPLDAWIAEKISAAELTRSTLDTWQLERLRELLDYVQTNSPFYARHLHGIRPDDLTGLDDLARLSLLDEDLLRAHGPEMLCVSQDEVARVITLQSSGTTGPAKRLFYSQADLELTVDFFHRGMATFTSPGQRVLILLPGPTPDSTGQLLAQGLKRLGAKSLVYGLAPDPGAALDAALEFGADIVVGFPIHVLALARLAEAQGTTLPMAATLLCSDYIPRAVVNEIDRIWSCPAYSHWGTVETGLGGGVECAARAGCHPREADLIVEVLDPETGSPLPVGQWGELTITTLTRRAMPLIRYRTGDLGRLLSEPCPCGSVLARLDRVRGRLGQTIRLPDDHELDMPTLDEALLPIPGVLDVRAELAEKNQGLALRIHLITLPGREAETREKARKALAEQGELEYLACRVQAQAWAQAGLSPAKRTINVNRSA